MLIFQHNQYELGNIMSYITYPHLSALGKQTPRASMYPSTPSQAREASACVLKQFKPNLE